MATKDTCCTIVPYFKVHDGKAEVFRAVCERCVEKTAGEAGCLYYGFSFDGEMAHCREGYIDAAAALAHLDNISPLLAELLKVADLERLEIHGPVLELNKLRGPLTSLSPRFFTLEYGFRK